MSGVWRNVREGLLLNGISVSETVNSNLPFRTERYIAWMRDIGKTDRRKNVWEVSDTTGMCANGVYPIIILTEVCGKVDRVGCTSYLTMSRKKKETAFQVPF